MGENQQEPASSAPLKFEYFVRVTKERGHELVENPVGNSCLSLQKVIAKLSCGEPGKYGLMIVNALNGLAPQVDAPDAKRKPYDTGDWWVEPQGWTSPENIRAAEADGERPTLTTVLARTLQPQVDAREGAEPVRWEWSANGSAWSLVAESTQERALLAAEKVGIDNPHIRPLYAAPPPRPDPATDGGWREAIERLRNQWRRDTIMSDDDRRVREGREEAANEILSLFPTPPEPVSPKSADAPPTDRDAAGDASGGKTAFTSRLKQSVADALARRLEPGHGHQDRTAPAVGEDEIEAAYDLIEIKPLFEYGTDQPSGFEIDRATIGPALEAATKVRAARATPPAPTGTEASR